MRWGRAIIVGMVAGSMLAIPTTAQADGGAYIELDKTHYLPGDTAVGEAYVYLLKKQQWILDRGPFSAFLLPHGASIQAGHPIPEDAIRLGTFSIEATKPKWFELRVSFTVPDLPGAFYSVAACNDPCTVAGFREPLVGLISVVRTTREGQLLTQRQRLRSRLYVLRRKGHKAVKMQTELQAQFDAVDGARTRLTGEVRRLNAQLAGAVASARHRASTWPFALWAVTTVTLLVLVGALVTRRRRARRTLTRGPTGIGTTKPRIEATVGR